MRSLLTAVVGGCALALFVLPVSAQPPGGGRGGMGRGGMGGPGMLVNNKSVQKELQMTDDQAKKAREATQQVREKHQEEMQALREMDPQEAREKGTALMRTMSEEADKALADVLKPEQMKRLKQISLQQRGAQSFTDPKVQEELKLTDDQKDKIKTINADFDKERGEIFQSMQNGGDREEAMKKFATLRTETVDKVKALLTDDQKKTWESITGAPFEVKFEARRGGGA
jgi:Spy/CpxP family protein refolding chaperone